MIRQGFPADKEKGVGWKNSVAYSARYLTLGSALRERFSVKRTEERMKSQADQPRWVLAFDGACSTCSAISASVSEASAGKLEVMPLEHDDVQRWRHSSMGASPKWAPTLLRVNGDKVRAWTGPAMSFTLARHLGLQATVRVLRALGRLRQGTSGRSSEASGSGMGRKRFLQLSGGLGVAIGLTLTGRTPAFARSERTAADAWVTANMDRLPRTYEEIIRHTVPYRKAIVKALSPEERTAIWLANIDRYRQDHPHATTAQRQVMDRASALAARVFVSPGDHIEEMRRLSMRAKEELGVQEAEAMAMRIGPADPPAIQARSADCSCSTQDCTCCAGGYYCLRGGCTVIPSDCGLFWLFDCNGRCG
ncbi:bacteriocin fulvocin C-related protein [Streptomyces glaucescens]|uniref:bacteriocin fulvocin C-related protein n=1 Tax=Streptomyces glaucescens TaxID=1907 RepID=UPI001B800612